MILYGFFFEEIIKFMKILNPNNDLYCNLTEKNYLYNFLHYLDIFFNEIRKFDIACGELDNTTGFPAITLRRHRFKSIFFKKYLLKIIINNEQIVNLIFFIPNR